MRVLSEGGERALAEAECKEPEWNNGPANYAEEDAEDLTPRYNLSNLRNSLLFDFKIR